jgi:23S rRNA G2445 N2-methylase RlmL
MLSPTYLATVLPGLEFVAESELRAKLPGAATVETLRGKILVSAHQPPADLLQLRTVDNLYRFIARFPVGPHRAHLADLAAAIAGLDLSPAAAEVLSARAEPGRASAPTHPDGQRGARDLHRPVAPHLRISGPPSPSVPASARPVAAPAGGTVPPRAGVTFYVNASRAGRHTYSRFEAAEAATGGILARQRRWRPGTAEAHDLEFRLDITGDEALVSLRLTPPSFRFRGQERLFARAALRPPVAHALVWLTTPQPSDCFVDPCCGSGTIVLERAAYAARRIIGGDRSPEAAATARHNLALFAASADDTAGGSAGRAGEAGAAIMRWDARRLPLAAGSIDRVATNLPFGHQILSTEAILSLYHDLARELERVLTPTGCAIVLTDQVEALERAAGATRLRLAPLAVLSLKGLHPRVFRLAHG